MRDNWSKFNEIVQNLLGLAVVGMYLYMAYMGKDVPIELTGFAAAVLIFFGFQAYQSKNGKNGTQ